MRKDKQGLDLDVSISTLKSPTMEGAGAMIIFRDQTEFIRLRNKVKEEHGFHGIIGSDHSMHKIFESIKNLADINVPVLIQGESGTGKEMVANALHKLSSRVKRPFIAVNCGALPEGTLESELFGHVRGAFTSAIRDKKGRFELADRGTIFLDEIADISPATQVKLLRVLQEKNFVPVGGEKTVKVDVRIICASNVNLKELVQKGGFREDLYYRLAVVPINLPPLRERGTDISLLADYFLDRYSLETAKKVRGFSPEAISAMMRYNWPGNVRELANIIHFALIQCNGEIIEAQHLPGEVRHFVRKVVHRKAGRPPKIDKERILDALAQANGNQSRAAEILGISRSTMYRMLKKTDNR